MGILVAPILICHFRNAEQVQELAALVKAPIFDMSHKICPGSHVIRSRQAFSRPTTDMRVVPSPEADSSPLDQLEQTLNTRNALRLEFFGTKIHSPMRHVPNRHWDFHRHRSPNSRSKASLSRSGATIPIRRACL